MKETYESMNVLLDLIEYTAHGWYICADPKVVAILTSLQTGYTKHNVFSLRVGQPLMAKTTLFVLSGLLEPKRLWAGTT